MAITTRPELMKLRSSASAGKRNGKTLGPYLSFPSKPMPHGLLLQFKSYNYKDYVSAIQAVHSKNKKGELVQTGAEENKNLGFVPAINTYNLLDSGPPGGPPEISTTTAIELPFPRTLQDSTNIRVASFERDFLYERIASGLASFDEGGGLGGFFENMKNSAEAVVSGVYDYAKSAGKTAGQEGLISAVLGGIRQAAGKMSEFEVTKATAMAGYLARNFIPGEIAKSMGVVGERVVNPQETLSFSGVDLRNFTFSWDLYPSNANDTQMITDIVNLIKRKSLPTTEAADGGGSLARAFLNYPDIVELNLLGVDESRFMRFKRCMVQNITVDYGAGGMPEIIKGGVPAAVSLSITFSELQIQTAQDYGENDGTDITPPVVQRDDGAAAGAQSGSQGNANRGSAPRVNVGGSLAFDQSSVFGQDGITIDP